MRRARLLTLCALTAALGMLFPATAAAAPDDPSWLGKHVSQCAHMHLPPLPNPPAIVCMDGDMMMTFPNFGAMVLHMKNRGM
jgi:hypothetical protein